MTEKASLLSLSPLDGRYVSQTSQLRNYFSESALVKHRVLVEALYIIALVEFLDKEKLPPAEKNKLLNWAKKITLKDIDEVKKIEAEIHHDVKAVEYFMRAQFKKLSLTHLSPWIHWGLTSEDINNLAYGLAVQKAKDEILVPVQIQLIKRLLHKASRYSSLVMPARTHGQIAVPTTVGKELIVFASRAMFFLKNLISLKLGGKLNGAVGNLNPQIQIFPQKDWLGFSKKFVKSLGLEPTLITTQIEPGGRLVYFLDLLRQLNNIWLDLAQDCWLYISLAYFTQKSIKKDVGSSTMPHKINPVHFENAEGNFQLANGFLTTLSNKLPVSRLQRDLSDSTIKRNLGIAFGYSLLALKNLIKGLDRIGVNKMLLKKEVATHPEMMAEGLQLILKVWGEEKAYEKIKLKVRGKRPAWQNLISEFKKEQKEVLKNWQIETYIGLAIWLTRMEIARIKKILKL